MRCCAVHCDDIKAARAVGPARLTLQKILGCEYQLLTLAGVNAGQRATPLCVLPVTNFDEYYCIAVKHDQIQLAALA